MLSWPAYRQAQGSRRVSRRRRCWVRGALAISMLVIFSSPSEVRGKRPLMRREGPTSTQVPPEPESGTPENGFPLDIDAAGMLATAHGDAAGVGSVLEEASPTGAQNTWTTADGSTVRKSQIDGEHPKGPTEHGFRLVEAPPGGSSSSSARDGRENLPADGPGSTPGDGDGPKEPPGSTPAGGNSGGDPPGSTPASGNSGGGPPGSTPASGNSGGGPPGSTPASGNSGGGPPGSTPASGNSGGGPPGSTPASGNSGGGPPGSTPASGNSGGGPPGSTPASGNSDGGSPGSTPASGNSGGGPPGSTPTGGNSGGGSGGGSGTDAANSEGTTPTGATTPGTDPNGGSGTGPTSTVPGENPGRTPTDPDGNPGRTPTDPDGNPGRTPTDPDGNPGGTPTAPGGHRRPSPFARGGGGAINRAEEETSVNYEEEEDTHAAERAWFANLDAAVEESKELDQIVDASVDSFDQHSKDALQQIHASGRRRAVAVAAAQDYGKVVNAASQTRSDVRGAFRRALGQQEKAARAATGLDRVFGGLGADDSLVVPGGAEDDGPGDAKFLEFQKKLARYDMKGPDAGLAIYDALSGGEVEKELKSLAAQELPKASGKVEIEAVLQALLQTREEFAAGLDRMLSGKKQKPASAVQLGGAGSSMVERIAGPAMRVFNDVNNIDAAKGRNNAEPKKANDSGTAKAGSNDDANKKNTGAKDVDAQKKNTGSEPTGAKNVDAKNTNTDDKSTNVADGSATTGKSETDASASTAAPSNGGSAGTTAESSGTDGESEGETEPSGPEDQLGADDADLYKSVVASSLALEPGYRALDQQIRNSATQLAQYQKLCPKVGHTESQGQGSAPAAGGASTADSAAAQGDTAGDTAGGSAGDAAAGSSAGGTDGASAGATASDSAGDANPSTLCDKGMSHARDALEFLGGKRKVAVLQYAKWQKTITEALSTKLRDEKTDWRPPPDERGNEDKTFGGRSKEQKYAAHALNTLYSALDQAADDEVKTSAAASEDTKAGKSILLQLDYFDMQGRTAKRRLGRKCFLAGVRAGLAALKWLKNGPVDGGSDWKAARPVPTDMEKVVKTVLPDARDSVEQMVTLLQLMAKDAGSWPAVDRKVDAVLSNMRIMVGLPEDDDG